MTIAVVGLMILTKEQIFSGGVNFGQKNTCKINKDGDLMSGISLYIKLGSLNKNKKKNDVCIKDLEMNCYCHKCFKTKQEQTSEETCR